MKVKELINQLKGLPQNEEILITSMDDRFCCEDFEVHSEVEDGAQELIMNVFIDEYTEGDTPENKYSEVVKLPNKRVFVDKTTGDVHIGYKYGHGTRTLKYEDLVKLAWTLDYGNSINDTLTHVDLPHDYPAEAIAEENDYLEERIGE